MINNLLMEEIERIREEIVLRKSGLVHSPGLVKPTCLSRLSEFDLVTDEDVLKPDQRFHYQGL